MAMRSGSTVGLSSRRYFCMPGDSNWKVAMVLPSANNLYVSSSSMGIWSMSTSSPLCVLRMLDSVSLIMVSVIRPRKSILISPTDSMTCPSYSVTMMSSPLSRSFTVASGAKFVRSSAPIITPQACTPTWRMVFSNSPAYTSIVRSFSSVPWRILLSSSTYL